LDKKLIYKIAISLIPGIGSINAKKLIAYTGSLEGVFSEKRQNLMRIPGIGEFLARQVSNKSIFEKAEKEIAYLNENKVKAMFYLDKEYPERLKQCADAPIIIYQKGTCNLNALKMVSVVGTRNSTQRGRDICDKIVAEIGRYHPKTVIVSGLAYGIDVTAHKAALKNKLKTLAVLAHGLSTLYPSVHQSVANEIVNQGALITDFISPDKPERNNFVKRNRIIAGLSDATIVVESGIKGGALITADMANSYNRDVFAFPGRVSDQWSKGCNRLIFTNKAYLIETLYDLEYIMGWEREPAVQKVIQTSLFHDLNHEERLITDLLQHNEHLSIDQISLKLQFPVSKVSSLLLNLEFKGLVKSLPGKSYKLFR